MLTTLSCQSTQKDENSIKFSHKSIPGMEIMGIVAQESDKDILFITGVRLFSNWGKGWTEGFFEASGKYEIYFNGNQFKITQIDKFELWDIVSGEIRFGDVYYRGDDGLWKVKNRIDRLKEVSRILKNVPVDVKEVSKYLFPELYKFDKLQDTGKLPQVFYDSMLEPHVREGSGIKWRVDYTQSVFPEQLWELRDSGTLYRDLTEAPKIFNAIYNIDELFDNLIKTESLNIR